MNTESCVAEKKDVCQSPPTTTSIVKETKREENEDHKTNTTSQNLQTKPQVASAKSEDAENEIRTYIKQKSLPVVSKDTKTEIENDTEETTEVDNLSLPTNQLTFGSVVEELKTGVCREMSSSQSSESHGTDVVLQLETLPYEIILHITSFIDSEFIIRILSRVSQLFHDLIDNAAFWKVRLKKRWPNRYPALSVKDDEFDWKTACYERELQHKRWSNLLNEMEYFTFSEGLFGAVDAVHLMEHGTLLATGSRDRYLNLLDIRKLDRNDPTSSVNCRLFCKANAHDGWIWSMASCDKVLTTGSWDMRIKFWDIPTMIEIREAKAHSAILCSHFEQNFYVAGGFDQYVYHFDPRAAQMLSKKRYHTKPILCLAADDKYIITGSEDSTISVYDRRSSKIINKRKLIDYPMSMSYDGDQLWIGDKGGHVHLIDASNGHLHIVDTYDVGHSQKVTGVIHTSGVMFTCSTDKTVKVLEPSLNPQLIISLNDINAEIAKISYQDGSLACASSGMFAGIYRPTTKVQEA